MKTKHSFFGIMSWFLSQAICMYMDLSSLTKLINKFVVTKLISTECKFCCYSLWTTKVWWMSRSFSSCMKNSKFWVRLHVYTISPAKYVRWVMDLPMASLNLFTPDSGKSAVQTKAIIHTAQWATTAYLQTEIIVACTKRVL